MDRDQFEYNKQKNMKEVCHGNNLNPPVEYSFLKRLIDTGMTIDGYSASVKEWNGRVEVRINFPNGYYRSVC